MNAALERLAALDAAEFDTGLSPETARACWSTALACADLADLSRPLQGSPPGAVAIIASANVFTAPLEWAYQLAGRGVRVLLKAASSQRASAAAIGRIEGVEVDHWQGGDVVAEAAALAQVDAAIVFGAEATIDAIRARSAKPIIGLGPMFGVTAWTGNPSALALDAALYDGRGCMSPAAVVGREIDIDALAEAMAHAESRWPRGRVSPEEASETRRLAFLARATGAWREGPGWAVARLPLSRLEPRGLPRVLCAYEGDDDEIVAALAPWKMQVGTLAGPVPGDYPRARRCAPGEMQAPPGDRRYHDGIDVMEALWTRSS